MPSLNFDYTQFLRRQNALYLLKYQNDPVEAGDNPAPINGFGGHAPSYRGSLHEQKAVRSLVRCLTSPMKPTTAMGYTTSSNRIPTVRPKTSKVETKPLHAEGDSRRAQSAPPAAPQNKADNAPPATPEPMLDPRQRPNPSRLSMMSAGSSDRIRQEIGRVMSRESRAGSANRLDSRAKHSRVSIIRGQSADFGGHSRASTISSRPVERLPPAKHPTGYAQTLYGASYWYAWPDERSQLGIPSARPKSYQRDRELNRSNDVIYHRHEGVVPKYMGYVPGYKFRHGATYGVLTVHAMKDGAVRRRLQSVVN